MVSKTNCDLPLLQLWGKSEQITLLKLLIALEEFEMAAEGFAVTKVPYYCYFFGMFMLHFAEMFCTFCIGFELHRSDDVMSLYKALLCA